MNNFNIQSLVLTAVIAMVYAAPVKPPHNITLLGHIRDDAETLLKTGLDIQVPRPRGIAETCVKKFFCFAEASLKKEHTLVNSNLENHLRKYNEYMKTTCHPTFDGTFPVKILLESIKTCATP